MTYNKLLSLITDADRRRKVENLMERNGVQACLGVNAKGTTKITWLHQLGIKNTNKMQFDFLLDEERADQLLDSFTRELKLNQPGQGIAFIRDIDYSISARHPLNEAELKEYIDQIASETAAEGNMYKKISVIVDLGLSEDVIEAAREGGARGGTILHGHGSATEEHAKLFGFQIVPEKEMVIILAPDNIVEAVIKSINRRLNLQEAGNGILYVEPVSDTRGLVEENYEA